MAKRWHSLKNGVTTGGSITNNTFILSQNVLDNFELCSQMKSDEGKEYSIPPSASIVAVNGDAFGCT